MLGCLAKFFNMGFWQQFVVTVAGVMVGVPLALWINSRQRRAAKTGEELAKQERKKQLHDALRENVLRNQRLVDQIKRDLLAQIIFYNVDLSVLDATAALKYDVLDNLQLCKALDNLRYELAHLHRKIDLQMTVAFDPAGMSVQLPNGERLNTASRQAIVNSTLEHLKLFPQFFAEVDRQFLAET